MRVATAQEVADLLKVRKEKVYEMAQKGEIPTLRRVGALLRFDLDAIQAWLEGKDRDGH